jgi:hypothetical protein
MFPNPVVGSSLDLEIKMGKSAINVMMLESLEKNNAS